MRSSDPLFSVDQPRPIRRRRPPNWARTLRYYYHRVVRLNGHPQAIARGVAAGVFAGWFPWFGVQILIAVMIATLIRGNRIAAAMATWVSNPLTYLPIFAFNFQVGRWLLKADVSMEGLTELSSWSSVMEVGQDVIEVLLFGCAVVGSLVAVASYSLSLGIIQSFRRQRIQKRRSRRL
jgi:uncharacterized protein (DUF2062 family)